MLGKAKKKARKLKAKAKRKAQELARRTDEKIESSKDTPVEDRGKDRAKPKVRPKVDQGRTDEGQPDPGAPTLNLSKAAGKRSGIRKPIIADVHREMTRQCVEGIQGWGGTPLNPQMPDGHKFVLLERQAGNVAESLASDSADSEHLYRECIRSAVVALAWAQALKSETGRRPTQWASS